MFPLPKGKPEFSKLEEAILQKWKTEKTFKQSVESRPADNPYRFYDGPPFITGTPHYGSLLSSIIKDVVPRYQTMLGKRVERVWGWDCHGLPIEQKVQAKLGLESNKAIEESEGGIQHFIDECYNYTSSTSAEWDWYVDHIGRWVDMEHAYRTMDQDYMESVMWVFKQIWEKGYVYEGKRVSWYSWKLSTPISNFEIAMDDSYQDVQDPAITVKFPLTQDIAEQDEVQGGKYAYTDDGYLRYVLAVVRNAEGEILMLQNKKYGNRWQCPGGKIDAGETAEKALKREIQEELGVDIEVVAHLGNRKVITEKTLWQGEYFEVKLAGEPVLQEPEKHAQMQWMKIVDDSELVHGYYLQYGEHVITEQLSQMYDALAIRAIDKKLPEIKQISMLAWTTTPWTIPMHMALAVHSELTYVLVQVDDEGYFVAKNRLETVMKGKNFTVITEYPGSFLVGKSYRPPFDYYVGKIDEKNFRVYHADFVTDTDGTGIAHEAPEFGDVDFQLAKQEGIHVTSAIDEAGKYTAEVPDYQGQLYIDCIDPITERLKSEGTLFKKEGITHRVPYCPRSNTPLMQKAQKSWFIDIQRIKKELIEQNEHINWFPDHFKHGRFLKSLESAPDWCISRSRFWGTPMPVWQNADGSERVVIDSREELYQRNKSLGQITKIIFVRHGQAESNVLGVKDTYGKHCLTELGQEQSGKLVDLLSGEEIHSIYSSPLSRSQKTISPLADARGISITIVDELREMDHGSFDLLGHEHGSLAEDERYEKNPDHKFGGGESQNEVQERMYSALKEIVSINAGKTIVIASHGGPLAALLSYLKGKNIPDPKNAEPIIVYLDNNTGKEINLHRPYIDRIYLPSEIQNTKDKEQNGGIKKVLGVHGWTSRGLGSAYEGKWLPLQDKLKDVSIQFDVPNFDQNKETKYSLWRDKLDILDVASYDTIIATSFGCPVIMQYLCEKNIKIKRLILVAPSGLSGNEYLEKVIPEMTENVEKIRGLAGEIIVTHSEDDESPSATFEFGKNLAKKISATFLPVNGIGHQFGGWGINFLSALVQHDAPMKRIPEVLDVWMDSASMPYAQVHYPFSFSEDSSILEATTESEREMCFEFFKQLWKDEFAIDFENAKRTIEEIRSDFWKSKVFYLKKNDILASSIQVSIQTMANNYVPAGALCMGRVGTLSSFRKQGLGSRLIKKALQYVASLGVKEMYTNAEIKNIKYYQGFGFESIQDVPENKGNTSSVYMKKIFTPEELKSSQSLVFPADFIAEYTGQIRAWFYVMHAIGVMVKGSPAFKNVAVTGVINGTDGRKMSKSYGNYPDPRETIERYGADALRFYLMGGPIMKGEDMAFSEMGIQDALKKVLLPLWNAYTFFATYANIDGWEPDGTEIWFVRHAKSTANEEGRMSGGENDAPLSDLGRTQVDELVVRMAQEKPFDAIYASPRQRVVNTIEKLGAYTLCDDLLEQDSGEYGGMLHADIMQQLGTDNVDEMRHAYRWNSVEPWDKFYDRIHQYLDQTIAANTGKKILLGSHAGVFRACTQYFYGLEHEDVFYANGIKNATMYRFPKTPKTHELDTWIMSQLHVLIVDTRKHMDNYDTQKACDGIVTFLDGLNNWYIRRNRRRFWKKEVDQDKCSAYETLHEVLTTVCQLLAPICPFMTEHLYSCLTEGVQNTKDKVQSEGSIGSDNKGNFESVHLTYFPEAQPLILNLTVNQKMQDLQSLTNLGLAIRGREKIRVRQPLRSASITLDLDESARATLAEELNVKEIHTISDIAAYVTITYSPDAKKIGATERRQWMKTIIADAKAGKGILLEDGGLQIDCPEAPEGKILLTSEEFETIYTPKEGSTIAFAGNAGYVIGLDTTLDEALTFEGYARDLIRAIQDARKEMGFQVTDRLQLALTSQNNILEGILRAHNTLIEAETLCTLSDTPSGEVKIVELDEDFAVEITVVK